MKKTFKLLVSSVALLVLTGVVLNASEAKYDNTNKVINPNGKKMFVLNYVEKADGVLDKKLTINIPKLPYKTSFNLCPDVEVADKCKGSISIEKEDGEYFMNYNVIFFEEMKGKKPVIRQVENTDILLDLNQKSDEDKVFIYNKMSTISSYWMLKDK